MAKRDNREASNAPKGPPRVGGRIAKGNQAKDAANPVAQATNQGEERKADGEVIHEPKGGGAPQGGQINGRQGDQQGIRM